MTKDRKLKVEREQCYLRFKLLVIAFRRRYTCATRPHSMPKSRCPSPSGPLLSSAVRCNVGSHRGKPRPRSDRISMAIAAYAVRINIIISKSKAGPRPVSALLSFSLPLPSLRQARHALLLGVVSLLSLFSSLSRSFYRAHGSPHDR